MSEIKETELAVLVKSTGLEQTTADVLLAEFEPFYNQAKDWQAKAEALVINGEDDIENQKEARTARLALVKVGTGLEERRKAMKANSLAYGKAVDAAANLLKDLIEPTKEILKAKEETKLRADNERKQKLKLEREAQLEPFGVNTSYFNLADMDEETFTALLTDKQNAYNQRIEDERAQKEAEELKSKQQQLHNSRRIEIAPYLQFATDAPQFLGEMSDEDFAELMQQLGTAKVAYDTEQAQIRADNERLRREHLEAAEALAAKNQLRNERNAIIRKYDKQYLCEDTADISEAEFNSRVELAKAAHEEAELARIAAEQKAAEERAEKLRLEQDLQAAKDAEAKRIADEQAAKDAELAKGDAQKVEDLKADLEALRTKYEFKSAKHKKLYGEVGELLNKTINHIIAKQ